MTPAVSPVWGNFFSLFNLSNSLRRIRLFSSWFICLQALPLAQTNENLHAEVISSAERGLCPRNRWEIRIGVRDLNGGIESRIGTQAEVSAKPSQSARRKSANASR